MCDFLVRVDDANLDGELRTDQYAALVLPELDNLRAAYAWATGENGDPQVAIALAAHAGSLIDYAAECADWVTSLRQRVEDGPGPVPIAEATTQPRPDGRPPRCAVSRQAKMVAVAALPASTAPLPEAFSRKIRSQPAARSAAIWRSRFWSLVETLA
jgi:hypothetical protein